MLDELIKCEAVVVARLTNLHCRQHACVAQLAQYDVTVERAWSLRVTSGLVGNDRGSY